MKRCTLLLALLVLGLTVLSACQSGAPGTMSIDDVWVRAAPAGENSAIYFVINNEAGEEDRLLSVEFDKAEVVELHLSKMDAAGNMAMEHQESVDVPKGQQVSFQPGGLHVMLMNLQEDLTEGQELDIVLHFEKAGDVTAKASVRAP